MSIKHILGAKSWQDFTFRLFFNPFEPTKGFGVSDPSWSLIPPNFSKIWGFDCSHWNGVVNMQTARANGARFVFIKARDGTVSSKYFAENWAGAKAAGIPRGAYCWLYPNAKVSAKLQAQAWWEAIRNDPGELPLVIDFEWTNYGGQSANPNYADLDIAVTEFNRIADRKPLLYSAPGYMSQFGAIPQALRDKFQGLWVAHWYTSNPGVPLSFTDWLFHQYSDQLDGSIVGYNPLMAKAADLNYCKSEQVLVTLTNGDVPTQPPPPPPPQTGDSTMTSEIFPSGVEIHTGRINGHSDYELKIIPPGSIDKAGMFKPSGCRLAENVVADKDLAFNFSPFYSPCTPNRGVRVGGFEYQIYDGLVQNSYAPFFWWDDLNRLNIDWRKDVWKTLSSALQGFRLLIKAGAKHTTSSAWSVANPQRAIGRLPDGSTVLLSVAGRGYRNSQGATLHEVTALLLQIGCDWAIDGDGGGSTRDALRIDGQVRVFQGTSEDRGAPAGGVIKFKAPLDHTIPEPPPTDPPPSGKTPFSMDVDGYKPFTGYLEPEDAS